MWGWGSDLVLVQQVRQRQPKPMFKIRGVRVGDVDQDWAAMEKEPRRAAADLLCDLRVPL